MFPASASAPWRTWISAIFNQVRVSAGSSCTTRANSSRARWSWPRSRYFCAAARCLSFLVSTGRVSLHPLDQVGIHLTGDVFGVGQQAPEEVDVGLAPLDHELGQGPPQPGQRAGAVQAGRSGGGRVTLLGRVDDGELLRLYGQCRAVIHPAIDDWGIVPREALAAGRPVVVFAHGGAADAADEGGVVFDDPTPASVNAAIDRLETMTFDSGRLRAAARRFDRAAFEARFAALVDAELQRSG